MLSFKKLLFLQNFRNPTKLKSMNERNERNELRLNLPNDMLRSEPTTPTMRSFIGTPAMSPRPVTNRTSSIKYGKNVGIIQSLKFQFEKFTEAFLKMHNLKFICLQFLYPFVRLTGLWKFKCKQEFIPVGCVPPAC